MRKLNGPKKPSRKSGEDEGDEGSPKPSSLDRLANLTRRVLRVPKSEIVNPENRNQQPNPLKPVQ
jgi:hypothetical protein